MIGMLGFAVGAVVAAAGAYLVGMKAGIEFWLYAMGAFGFALAAAGQYFKAQEKR